MAVDSLFTLSMIKITHATTPINIFGINDSNVSEGLTEVLAHGAGAVDPSMVALLSIEPMSSVTVTELAKVLAVVGIDGLCIGSTQTYLTVEFYFAQIGKCAPRLGSSQHIKLTMNEGLIIPTQIQASQGQTATLGLEFHASYDGTNVPLTVAVSQSIPAASQITEQFTLGPGSINGTDLKGIQQTTVNFGLTTVKEHASGEVYPTFIGITSRNPSIEYRTKKMTSINTFALTGTAQSSTDSWTYFRKQAANGTLTADATAEHIKVSVDDGIITAPSSSASNNQTGDTTVRIAPVYDGSNAILAITTASAIT